MKLDESLLCGVGGKFEGIKTLVGEMGTDGVPESFVGEPVVAWRADIGRIAAEENTLRMGVLGVEWEIGGDGR